MHALQKKKKTFLNICVLLCNTKEQKSLKSKYTYLRCKMKSCCLRQRFSTPVLAPPRSAHFACLCCLNTPDSDHQLIRRKFHEWTVFRLTCSLHSVHCSLLPKHEKSVDVYFGTYLFTDLFTDLRYASVITHRRNLLVKCDKIYLCK